MKKIALIPIDNRPICYDLVKDILGQDTSLELFMPENRFLGGLIQPCNIDEIYNFLNNLDHVDILVIALDTIAYGGLVSSRRCNDSYEEIKKRLEKFKEVISQKADKVLAFSSIMRISNNNINEEEKEYWSKWGKRIFEFSYYQHKSRKDKSYNCVYNQVPQEILDDYLNTRNRNFKINEMYLDWLEDKTLDMLVFSKDDTGKYGLNVEEAEKLEEKINKRNLKAKVKTGADEIPLSLLANGLLDNENIKIKVNYAYPKSIDKISKYEDISVKDCTEGQIELADCKVVQDNEDLNLFVNNFEFDQGDLVLGDLINSSKNPKSYDLNKPYFIADINNANGADNGLIKVLLENKIDKNLYSYCGYNTSANTLGCAILSATVKFLAIKNNSYNDNAFKKLMFIRLLDDWAYQANIRKFVRENAPNFLDALKEKSEEFKQYEQKIANFLDFKYNKIDYSLPWDRSFEVRIDVESL